MKIAVIKKISNKVINDFVNDNIEMVIFHKVDSDVEYSLLASNFKLVHAFDDAVNLNWFNFERCSSKLSAICDKLPELFSYKGIDLMSALKKDLFWSSVVQHSLLFQAEKYRLKENEIVFYNERSFFLKKLSLARKIFFNNDSSYSINTGVFSEERTNKIAFRVNDTALIALYGNLFEKLGNRNIVSFQSRNVNNPKAMNETLAKTFSENINSEFSKGHRSKISFSSKIKLVFIKQDTEFLINFIHALNKLCNHVDEYDKLFRSGVKKVVLNAGENEGEGNVVCAVAKKYNVTTFNYMNGTKAKDPHNVETFFDFWFMPDTKTQELILSYCKVEKKQVPVTGHLMQELAGKHQYSGTLENILGKLVNKKVIALFTSKVFVNEINTVIDFLLKYVEAHTDVIILIRKHPAETESYKISHDCIIELEKPEVNNSQLSLFDLLIKSNVSISFSSTVSYQSSWFNIPSINYENSERSRLTYVDGEKVVHINSIDKLESYLNTCLLDDKRIIDEKRALDASEEIATIILQA